jgi:hypothetical protein
MHRRRKQSLRKFNCNDISIDKDNIEDLIAQLTVITGTTTLRTAHFVLRHSDLAAWVKEAVLIVAS